MSLLPKKIRFLFRLTSAFFKKRWLIILIGIILGILFYESFSLFLNFFPSRKKVIKIGTVGKYSISEIPSQILSKISMGLTQIAPNGEAVSGLADSWEFSEDGKIYTFYFGSEKFFWHNGEEFKLEDINYNFRDAKILPIGSNILKIVLNEAFSPLPIVLSQPLFKKGLVGLGSYKVKKVERSGQTLKSVNLLPVEEKSSLPAVTYRFYINDHQLRTAFKLGEINVIDELETLGEFSRLQNVIITQSQREDRYVALFFNTNKEPFSEKSLRQVIAYAIEKAKGEGRAISPISSSSWAFNPGVKKYEKDTSKAKQLLTKVKLDPKKVFLLYCFPSLEEEAKKIQAELKSIGIEVEIKITHFLPDDFDLLLAVQKIPADPDQYSLWHTAQPGNLTHFSNPRIDKLLEDGRKETSKEERKKIYFDFQRFLVEESPVVFLYHPTYYSIERK